MTLQWNDLFIEYQSESKKKRLAGPFHGQVTRGQVHAIFSGCPTLGRALLQILAIKEPFRGEISWDGHQRASRDWIRRTAFIPEGQHSIPHRLTVRERLLKAIALKRPSLSKEERKSLTKTILELTNLTQYEESRILGGRNPLPALQCKLATLAIELISRPEALFITNPFGGEKAGGATTGHNLADDIIEYGRVLKRVAEAFSMAILVQLDESRFATDMLVDTVTVAMEGRPLFFGDYCELLGHMSQIFENSAVRCSALLQRFLSPHPPSEATALTEKHRLMEELPNRATYESPKSPFSTCALPPSVEQASDPTMFAILTATQLAEDIRHWHQWLCTIISYAIVYLLVSFLYFQMPLNAAGLYDRSGLFYFISFNLFLLNGLPQLVKFQVQASRMEHEHRQRWISSISFVLSQFISSLVLPLLLILIFGTALYYITGLRTDGFQHVVVFLADLLLLAGNSVALGMMIAAVFVNVEFSQLALPFLASIFFVYGNLVYAPDPTWILRWIQYLTPLYYSSQCLLQNELSGTRFTLEGTNLNQFLHNRGLDQMPIAACLPILFGFTMIFLITTCIVVEIRNKRYFT